MQDARISTSLPSHPKTKKLIRRLGPAAGWSLVCLFLWVAQNRSDGNLAGLSDEDVELSADWSGDDGAFVEALSAVRFIDGISGAYTIHDWSEHNPWAAGAESRSAKARWNAAKRHHGEAEADRLVPEYAAVRNASSNASSKPASTNVLPRSNAPSPSPSPSPSKSLEPANAGLSPALPEDAPEQPDANGEQPEKGRPPCPQERIVALYHETLPELRQVREWNETRRRLLARRWSEQRERQSLGWWREFFGYVRKSRFLMGQTTGRDGRTFDCDLEWLVRPTNFAKVVEGKYEDGK